MKVLLKKVSFEWLNYGIWKVQGVLRVLIEWQGRSVHLPLPYTITNANFFHRAICWFRGGVGGKFPESHNLLTSPSSRALSCSAFCSFILKSFICLLNSPEEKENGKNGIKARLNGTHASKGERQRSSTVFVFQFVQICPCVGRVKIMHLLQGEKNSHYTAKQSFSPQNRFCKAWDFSHVKCLDRAVLQSKKS